MTRVSENSNKHAVTYSLQQAKAKMEDLQMKGATLKKIMKPSDDPSGNIELLGLRSQRFDITQYKRNQSYALAQLNISESALAEVSEILLKAKEIAVSQASDFYNQDIRKNVSAEVEQLKNQLVGVGNRRIGNKFIFAGFKTLSQPFERDGKYNGDNGKIFIEVNKDFFVPINVSGEDVFFLSNDSKLKEDQPMQGVPRSFQEVELARQDLSQDLAGRSPASASGPTNKIMQDQTSQTVSKSLFNIMDRFINALHTNDTDTIQTLLEDLDSAHEHVVRTRTKLGATINSVMSSEQTSDELSLRATEQESKIEDADVTELFSDIARHQAILKASYKTSSDLLSHSLVDFIR